MDIFNEEAEIDSDVAYKIAKLLPDELFYKLKRKIDALTLDKNPITIKELLQDISETEAKKIMTKIKKVTVKEKPKFVRQISKEKQKKMLEKKKIMEEAKAKLERIKKDIEDRN